MCNICCCSSTWCSTGRTLTAERTSRYTSQTVQGNATSQTSTLSLLNRVTLSTIPHGSKETLPGLRALPAACLFMNIFPAMSGEPPPLRHTYHMYAHSFTHGCMGRLGTSTGAACRRGLDEVYFVDIAADVPLTHKPLHELFLNGTFRYGAYGYPTPDDKSSY